MKIKRSKIVCLIFLLSCTFPLFTMGQSAQPAGSYTGGYLDFELASRVFELPLFGTNSPATYRFLGSQILSSGTNLSLWFDSGFPNATTNYGIEASDVPFLNGRILIRAGDLSITSLRPENFDMVNQNAFPVVGAGLQYASSNMQWSIAAGRGKYSQGAPGLISMDKSTLLQGEILQRLRSNYLGLMLTAVKDPTYAQIGPAKNWGGALGARFDREFSPVSLFSGVLLLSEKGSFAASTGYQHNFQTAEINFSLYSFGNDFPYLPPVFRPGEDGVEIGGRYYTTETSNLSAVINYYKDDLVQRRSDFRGHLGYGWSLGDSRPYLQIGYYRNEINFDPLSIEQDRSSQTDRFSFSLSRASFGAFSNFRMEHVFGNRTQATYDFRRVFHERSYLNGSFLVQRETNSRFGFTAETSLERPWKPQYFYLFGAGVAHRHLNGTDSAEGIARFGISRRISQSGWRAQVEFVVPFPIGLQRSNLSQRQIQFQIGQRFAWKSMESIKTFFSRSTDQYGSIEGIVHDHGQGIQGLAVLIDGQPLAVTGSNGRFKIGHVLAGPVTLTLDIRKLDAGISIVGGPMREVLVAPNEHATVDFGAAHLLYLQGAILICKDGKQIPARGAKIDLVGTEFSSATITSDVGGFEFDQIPPGLYHLSVKNQSTKIEILVKEDIHGYVIKIPCDQIW